jgi:hypothetical protein
MLALKALALSARTARGKGSVTVTVSVGGRRAKSVTIPESQRDVVHFVSLREFAGSGSNEITLKATGEGSPCFQLVGSCHVPWHERPQHQTPAPLSVEVEYDKATVARGGFLKATATVKNISSSIARMVMVDIGIPPGFTPERGDLDELVKECVMLNRYEIVGRQIILYLSDFEPKVQLRLAFRMRAKFLLKAKSGFASAWPYYEPQSRAVAEPLTVTVEDR